MKEASQHAYKFKEGKENYQPKTVISLERENYYGDENFPETSFRPKPRDPRKGTMLELTNKTRKSSLPQV